METDRPLLPFERLDLPEEEFVKVEAGQEELVPIDFPDVAVPFKKLNDGLVGGRDHLPPVDARDEARFPEDAEKTVALMVQIAKILDGALGGDGFELDERVLEAGDKILEALPAFDAQDPVLGQDDNAIFGPEHIAEKIVDGGADGGLVIVDIENEEKEPVRAAGRPLRRLIFDPPGNDLESADLLLDAILEDLEILPAEIPDRPAFEKNADGDFDERDGDILLELLLRGRACGEKKNEAEDPRNEASRRRHKPFLSMS